MYSRSQIALVRKVRKITSKLDERLRRLNNRMTVAIETWANYRHNFNHYVKHRSASIGRENTWKQKYLTLAHQVEMHNRNFGHLRFLRLSNAQVGDQIILKVSRDERLKLKELLKRRKHARRG